ncbi:MAG: SDR family oxidoreductase [Candidatus Limiplasma sp.]|nr:SDR family oxidoreductase [Candidatus Limiplasma sp.]
MELGYHNKVVGITGAASQAGIGFAIAAGFLREGARVFICDIDAAALDAAVEALSSQGEVRGYRVNVGDEREVAAMFETAVKDFGSVDLFVNNAGIYPQSALCEMDGAAWDRVMNVNLKSVFLCACAAKRQMEKQGGGVILNAASFASLIPSAGSGAYAASKAAVYSLTKTMAAEFAPFGIRVNGFIPGVIETGMTKAVVDARRSDLEGQIALGRLGTPKDVANAVLFLGSDAAAYISGAFLEISGGKLCVQNPDYGYKRWKGEARHG